MENYVGCDVAHMWPPRGISCIGWKLWYCDKDENISTFSSRQGTWQAAPQRNVQYLTQWWTDGKKTWKTVHGGCDVYVLDNDQAEEIGAICPNAKLSIYIDPDMLIDLMHRASDDEEEFQIMPTYESSNVASDLAPSWPNASLFDNRMSTTESTATQAFSVPAGTTRSASFITGAGVPNSDAWENGGTQTVGVDISSGDMDVTARCRIVRLDSSGNIQESGAFTATQTMQADRTYSPVSPTWTTQTCSDRIAIEWEFVETGGHSAGGVTWNVGVGTLDTIVTDITENNGTCSVATRRIFIS